jgi:hypothetical protein
VRRVHWLGRWRARIEVWLENHKARRELRRCASLDPRFARDIGFSSDELAVVCAAPPWKAVTRPPSSLERGPSVGVQDLPGTVRQHAVPCARTSCGTRPGLSSKIINGSSLIWATTRLSSRLCSRPNRREKMIRWPASRRVGVRKTTTRRRSSFLFRPSLFRPSVRLGSGREEGGFHRFAPEKPKPLSCLPAGWCQHSYGNPVERESPRVLCGHS